MFPKLTIQPHLHLHHPAAPERYKEAKLSLFYRFFYSLLQYFKVTIPEIESMLLLYNVINAICNKGRYDWIIVPNTSLLLNKHIKSFLPILFTCSKMKNGISCYNEYHIYLSCVELNEINIYIKKSKFNKIRSFTIVLVRIYVAWEFFQWQIKKLNSSTIY
mgnify:CR=1 FL=1